MKSPFVLVVFGATGDLMSRKLAPALYRLVADSHVAVPPFLVGVGRRKISEDGFREMMAIAVRGASGPSFDLSTWEKLARNIFYQQGYFEDKALYGNLIAALSEFDSQMRACVPRFFYLATPPSHYETILTSLRESKLSEGCGQGTNEFTRVLIEKPFGKDLATAISLEKLLSTSFSEKQIYRIDHYLGKETVQNILSLRFGNGIFEPTWNSRFLDHVQITLAEESGVGTRAGFYEGVGALRDTVQNHMMQMLAFTAMEPPGKLTPEAVRKARANVLSTIQKPTDVILGQYEGYRKEEGVAQGSTTETFVALKLLLDTPRWRGVPFYLRTGKNLKRRDIEISLHYKKPVSALFDQAILHRNIFAIRIGPNEGLALRLMVKEPGLKMNVVASHMEFDYAQVPAKTGSHAEYEKLLLDALRGDQMLFAHTNEISASWAALSHITAPLTSYKPGTWGPKEAEKLIEKDGRHWFLHED